MSTNDGPGVGPGPRLEVKSFLRRSRTEILAEWKRLAREIPVAQDLPGISLVDHIPELIDEVAAVAEQHLAGRQVDAPAAARRHAVDRLGVGFDIAAVVRELSLLRRCILTLWNREHGRDAGEIVALNVALDGAVMESMSRYVEARERTLTAIDQISTAALQATDLHTLLQRLLSVFQTTTRSVDMAGIMLLEDDGRLRVRAAVGLAEEVERGFSVAVGEGFSGKVARDRKPYALRAAYLDPLVKSDVVRRRGIRALYGVPLIQGERLIGVALMGSATAHEFSSDDRHLFDSMAARATMGISQHILREGLERSEEELQHIAAERAHVLAKLESLLAASPLGIAFLDRALRYWRVNEAFATMNGRPAIDHLGRSLAEVTPATGAELEPILRRVVETGEPVLNREVSCVPPGTPDQLRSFLATFFPVREPGGSLLGVGGILVENTELRRAQEALRLSEARLASILEHAPAAIFVLDDERRFVLANQRTAAVLGYPGQDLVGRRAPDLVSPELEASHRDTDQLVLREHRAITVEEEAQSPEGARTFLTVKFPIPSDHGSLVCGIATDITDRKRMEEALRTAVRAREDVLAVVSHDLRSPLGAVKLSAALLLGELAVDARARKHLEMIQRASARMEHLIEDLLDTASIDAGKLALELRRESAESVIAEALDLQEPIAREKGIELRRSCSLEGVDLLCDRDRVLQVCGNLISNAIKFCRPGDSVTVTGEPFDDHVLLSVADTGPGVEPELVPHLFEPYWSAPAHAKHGTGLGLYIAKGIIEAHGGRIWVETQPGAGARFFFTLPSRANGRVAYPSRETDPGAPLR